MALDLPARARSELVAWRERAVEGRSDLRVVAPEALHVTLVFIGYRPEKEIDAIGDLVRESVAGLRAPRLRAVGVAPLPPRRPRLFALNLSDDGGRAVALQAAVSDALAAARVYRPEKRPFWPHITFARVKRDARAAALDADPPPSDAFDATDVTLYRSRLSPGGAVYEPLARVALEP